VPANSTPQFHDAEERVKAAESTEEKVAALEEMLRVIPKHKGTEKMQADLKTRLAKLRKDVQKQKASGGHKRPFYQIDREGIGRAVICGAPNSGKSDLISRLTHARPEVADYPFTTRLPIPGMMQFEDVQIQLIDTPPIAEEVLEAWQLAMIQQADTAVLLFDVAAPDLLDRTDFVLTRFAEKDIPLLPAAESPIIVLGNKVDLPGGKESFDVWKELFAGSIDPLPFSVHAEGDLLDLKGRLFRKLNVVRVYTKPPGAKVEKDQAPYVLWKGATVLDVAATIHKDLVGTFKFARIWAEGKFDGQMVERDYEVQDGDLLEIHA